MRVWTNGKVGRVWVSETLYRVTGKKVEIEGWMAPTDGARETSADEVAAWPPSGGSRLDEALQKGGHEVLDAIALDEDRVAAVLADGRNPPRLVVGEAEGDFEVNIPLKGKGVRVEWPEGLLWKNKASYSRATIFKCPSLRSLRLRASAQGVAVSSSTTGQVAVLRPDGKEIACLLRVPASAKTLLDAVPTEPGVLVTLVAPGGKGALIHLGDDGSVLGSWARGKGRGLAPTLLVDEDKALVFDPAGPELVLLRLPALEELTRKKAPCTAVDACVAPDGRSFLFAEASRAASGSAKGKRLTVAKPVELSGEAERPEEPEEPTDDDATMAADLLGDGLDDEEAPVKEVLPSKSYAPKKSDGPPRIVFPSIKRAPAPWTASVGGSFVLPILVRSGGTESRGLVIALSGDAVASGLVVGSRVTCGRHSAKLEDHGGVFRAVLPDVEIPRGVAMPLDPKPKGEPEKLAAEAFLSVTHLELELEGRGAAPGSGILAVVVAAEKSPAAPLKWMRPFTVT